MLDNIAPIKKQKSNKKNKKRKTKFFIGTILHKIENKKKKIVGNILLI